MPASSKTFHNQERRFDVRPDRYDIRDRIYQPKLVNLPPVCPDPDFAHEMLKKYGELILNQGTEGACTGFGLAAMINYLRFRQSFFPKGVKIATKDSLPEKVSERMIYENARLYDEWPGEDYDGSSCRGAMKGWHRHGVCLAKTWPYMETVKKKQVPGKAAPHWAEEAAKIPLGAYYRIETDDITAMQSAIHEVGAVYCSANVHDGWDLKENLEYVGNVPVMTWKPGKEAPDGHAFAIVGYNCRGFIVQNSWGPTWGYHGFALLNYGDWLENATDAWVATMGVPACAGTVSMTFSSRAVNRVSAAASIAGAGAGADAGPAAPWTEDTARQHSMVLGNDGVVLRASGAFGGPEFIEEVVFKNIKAWMKASATNRRVAIYAHGGLNDEEAAIKRVQIMAPYFKANGVFPVFVVWKTGWKESLHDIGVDVLKKILPSDFMPSQSGSIGKWLKDKVSEGADYTVETTLGFLGKSLWRQMKQNAEAAGAEHHGAVVMAEQLAALKKQYSTAQVHVVGHSAGSIWLGHLLSTLPKDLVVDSCHLFAPACTVAFANEHYGKALNRRSLAGSNLWVSNLSEDAERADNVGGFYGKSLLYFVSRACEESHKTPILGMEATWNDSLDKESIFNKSFADDITSWRRTVAAKKVAAPFFKQASDAVNNGKEQNPPSHGGFDNDIEVVTRTLSRILGLGEADALPVPVKSLAGF